MELSFSKNSIAFATFAIPLLVWGCFAVKGDEMGDYGNSTIQPSRSRRCQLTGELPSDCVDLLNSGCKRNGVYKVYSPDTKRGFRVFCDQRTENGGWLVFQRRMDGSEDFFRGWADYKFGFGDIQKEFWLGNEIIHRIMNGRSFVLRVELEDFDGVSKYAEYRLFVLGDASTYYRLTAEGYRGTAGDSLDSHDGYRFVTKDSGDINSCARKYTGAWWYRSCHSSNLNGLYLNGTHTSYANGVNWDAWRGYHYSLKRVEMKMRPW